MARARDIVVIGGSAGGTEAVREIVGGMPDSFPAAVFVVLHRQQNPPHPELLANIVSWRTRLPTHSASDEQPIERGHIYVAPPDTHMVLLNGLIRLESSPLEHRFRPSLDVLFKSAAMTYGRRTIGVLLSGKFGPDGAAGLWQIKNRGGVTIVQDPKDAEFPGMPKAALESIKVDHVLPVEQIGPKVIELVLEEPSMDSEPPRRILIVEDESVVATNLAHGLKEMGYDVIDWVPTGEAAIEMAEREFPDLILMDIRLAGPLTGIEAARRIWQKLQIPIVYCTAHADLETLKAVQTTESYGYVVKPFESPAVRAAIELALARREKELR